MWRGGGATRGRSIDRGGSTRTGQLASAHIPARTVTANVSSPLSLCATECDIASAPLEVRGARGDRGADGGGGWDSRETWRAAVNAM